MTRPETLPPRPWRPGALLLASLAVHVAAAAALLFDWALWPWALGALVANHLVLTAAGLWPKSRLLGPNWTRLPAAATARGEVAITIDDGPDPDVTPAVLDILDAHRARASFFCIGHRAVEHPELLREIVRRGHAVENHTQHHLHHFSLLGPAAMHREIGAAQDSLARLGARTPRFFRAPAGLRNPFLDYQLARLGLTLASWTRRGFDTRERDAGRVAARLLEGLAAGDILLLHDGHAALDRSSGRPVIIEVLPRLLEACARAGLRPVTLEEAGR